MFSLLFLLSRNEKFGQGVCYIRYNLSNNARLCKFTFQGNQLICGRILSNHMFGSIQHDFLLIQKLVSLTIITDPLH